MCDKQTNPKNLWGKEAEQIATDYLVSRGYVVRERNWRPPHSHLEVDIITQYKDFIVFVEVKARGPKSEDPLDAVDEKKIKRLVRAANSYLNMLPFDFQYRFDIITVDGTPESYSLDHIEDAFLPPLSHF